MSTTSRQTLQTALVPNQWVCMIRDQEGVRLPAGGAAGRTIRDYYHRAAGHLEFDPANAAPATIILQDSNNGVNWTTRATWGPVVPGGQLDWSANHIQSMFRVMIWSTATGFCNGVLNQPEVQANPDYDQQPALACAAFCEVDCETGAQVYGAVG